MKKKLVLIVIISCLIVGAILYVLKNPDANVSVSQDESSGHSEVGSPPKSESPKQTTSNGAAGELPASSNAPQFHLTKSSGSVEAVAESGNEKDKPFKFIGSGAGSVGKIVDKQGSILMETDAENGVFMFGISVAPDNRRVLVSRGDAKYDVFTPSTGETIRLPQRPPGENVLGFSWHWLDDETLIGVSGKTIPFRDDQVGPAREEPIISRSVLYLFDLDERKMAEVALPPALRTMTVSISGIDTNGKVQLRPEGNDVSYTDVSLGWFEVRPVE